MLILVSNDDGIDSPGLKKLASELKKIKKARVVVVAPSKEQSATSHSLTLHRPLRIEQHGKDEYAVTGTPTDAVMLGVHKILKKKPDVVVSGINRGANLGEDVHYSGTVAAAVEGAIMGVPAIAVSLVGIENFNFGPAATFAKKLTQQVLKKGLPKGTVLNVNVPNLAASKIKGYKITRLGKHSYGDVIVKNVDPRGKPYYWIGGNPFKFEKIKQSDCEAFDDGKISVTPLSVDMTYYDLMDELNSWEL
ncbi:5'/3'-nucleotidase SurE [bacterium]|nr:5'/3'-nucleotidase SurE [bacterium]